MHTYMYVYCVSVLTNKQINKYTHLYIYTYEYICSVPIHKYSQPHVEVKTPLFKMPVLFVCISTYQPVKYIPMPLSGER